MMKVNYHDSYLNRARPVHGVLCQSYGWLRCSIRLVVSGVTTNLEINLLIIPRAFSAGELVME
jgi:hypothetical protein